MDGTGTKDEHGRPLISVEHFLQCLMVPSHHQNAAPLFNTPDRAVRQHDLMPVPADTQHQTRLPDTSRDSDGEMVSPPGERLSRKRSWKPVGKT